MLRGNTDAEPDGWVSETGMMRDSRKATLPKFFYGKSSSSSFLMLCFPLPAIFKGNIFTTVLNSPWIPWWLGKVCPTMMRSEGDRWKKRTIMNTIQHVARCSYHVKMRSLVGTKWRKKEGVWRWRAKKWNHTLLNMVTLIVFLPIPPSPTCLVCRELLEDGRFTDWGESWGRGDELDHWALTWSIF